MADFRILVVRLGAMGDVLHALPAVASLKHSFPRSHLSWVIHPRWAPLIEGCAYVDEVVPFERSVTGLRKAWRRLRSSKFDLAVDFQGLLQSALVAAAARPDRLAGFHRSEVRERFAAMFYSTEAETRSEHFVDQNLELATAAGATNLLRSVSLPPGRPEGTLPEKFILASPLAGWGAKQWPLEYYEELAPMLPLPLVLNGPASASGLLQRIRGVELHFSGIAGLIDATRRAHAVIGLDSGPIHLAAALEKPGVAIFGPTDPLRNGPYGGTIRVLRDPSGQTSHKRRAEPDASMRAIRPMAVAEALDAALKAAIVDLPR